MLSNKQPRRLFDLLMTYKERDVCEVPGIGNRLHDYLTDYYGFRQEILALESQMLLAIGTMVRVRIAESWHIYLGYVIARFAGAAGNTVNADDKLLVMITDANRGGKSTFLRSIGLAQLMMQCGMFVPAESFRANVCHGIFTHYKRGGNATMRSGKLDEELSRMSSIVDNVTPNSIVLLNESFASTNEREGSEIARQIVRALVEAGLKVFYVTHMFDLAHGFYLAKTDTALFLRAERLADGGRTSRLEEGEPLPTSYGEDLYRRIFGAAPDAAMEALAA